VSNGLPSSGAVEVNKTDMFLVFMEFTKCWEEILLKYMKNSMIREIGVGA
jgi:hypothetical protein